MANGQASLVYMFILAFSWALEFWPWSNENASEVLCGVLAKGLLKLPVQTLSVSYLNSGHGPTETASEVPLTVLTRGGLMKSTGIGR